MAEQLDLVDWLAAAPPAAPTMPVSHRPAPRVATAPTYDFPDALADALRLLPGRPAAWTREIADIPASAVRIIASTLWTRQVDEQVRRHDHSKVLLCSGQIMPYSGGWPEMRRLVLLPLAETLALNAAWPLEPTEITDFSAQFRFAPAQSGDGLHAREVLSKLTKKMNEETK